MQSAKQKINTHVFRDLPLDNALVAVLLLRAENIVNLHMSKIAGQAHHRDVEVDSVTKDVEGGHSKYVATSLLLSLSPSPYFYLSIYLLSSIYPPL